MNWEQALIVATLLGQFFGMAARWLPFIPNVLAPKVTWLAAFIANLALVVQKFMQAAGWEGAWIQNQDGTALAGAGPLWFLAAIVLAGLFAYAQVAAVRWVGEKGAKPVVSKDGQPGTF